MASNSSGGGGSTAGTGSGRRLPLSLSGGSTVTRLQQSSGSNSRSNSPQNGNKKITESFLPVKKSNHPRSASSGSTSSSGSSQNGVSKPANGKDKAQNGSSTGKDQKVEKSKDKLPEKKAKEVGAENKDKDGAAEKTDVEVVVENKQMEVVPENKEVVSENKEVVSENKEVVSENKEVVSENKEEVVSENKEVVSENKEVVSENKEVVSENKEVAEVDNEETKKEAATVESTVPASQTTADAAVIDDEVVFIPDLSTPTKDRKSTRKSGSQQTSPISKASNASPAQKMKTESVSTSSLNSLSPQEDVDMESLQVDSSPIRSVHGNSNALPTATSTPGRSLFSFRGSNKQSNEVELAAQTSSSPVGTPARTFAQISGRRSIRPVDSLTPSKIGTYRCGNSDLDTSNCTNASMNATVGSEIPNSSSFSFSFFGRGRKRERTPPPLAASQSTSDLGHDVDMSSPPKRARFDLFSLNLASPFSLLRSRFSKATIGTPTRLRLEPNSSGVEEQHLNTSSAGMPEEVEVEEEQPAEDVTVGQEAVAEDSSAKKDVKDKNVDGQDGDKESSDGENIAPVEEVADAADVAGVVAEGRSICSIM
ncbi:GM15205 [Drosophila sechellia]|uniref:GM15205 n=2 Tax=Drosophila sechellia TaxID=7238 RepID=B4IBM3_DROSE|nr:GM15205 [Drosophila sechellia]